MTRDGSPRIALGCNNFGARLDLEATTEVVTAALESGVDVFDTADAYGDGASEALLGVALRGRRERARIVTKFGIRRGHGEHDADASRDYTLAACDASLRRLGTDHIDVFVLHRHDPSTDPHETLDALAALHQAGKIGAIGCSNLTASQIDAFAAAARLHPELHLVAGQDEWSLLERRVEAEVLPALVRSGMRIMPYFPLAAGLLTGKYRNGARPTGTRIGAVPMFDRFGTDEMRLRADRLAAIGDRHGYSLLQLALGWVCSRAEVDLALVGASSPEQLRANLAASRTRLGTAVLEEIETATVPTGCNS